MNKTNKKIEKKKNEELNPFLNLFLQYLYTEMYNHKTKTLKQKIIRTTIFLFIIGMFTSLIYGEGTLVYSYPYSLIANISVLNSLFLLTILTTFARSVSEFLIFFLLIFIVASTRVEALSSLDKYTILYIILAGGSIYSVVYWINLLYYNVIKMTSSENNQQLKTLFYKGYEQLHSDFDHASNILAVIITLLIAIKSLKIINNDFMADSIVLAASYIAIIKYCASIMKRKLIKFKEKQSV